MGDLPPLPAVKIGAVAEQLDGIRRRNPRDRPNEREQDFRSEIVATIQDRKAHAHSFLKRNKRTVKTKLTIKGGPALEKPSVAVSSR
jgi:hypothetical protein